MKPAEKIAVEEIPTELPYPGLHATAASVKYIGASSWACKRRPKRSMMEIRGETNPHLSQTFHYGLGHAIGVSLSIEDMIRNARYLAIHFEEPGFSKLFTSYFYKKSKLTMPLSSKSVKSKVNCPS